jgi:hypothetical protein
MAKNKTEKLQKAIGESVASAGTSGNSTTASSVLNLELQLQDQYHSESASTNETKLWLSEKQNIVLGTSFEPFLHFPHI